MALFVLALTVSLGTAFPEVEASATLDGSALLVNLVVTVESVDPTTVVAHVGTSTEQETFQLGPGGGRTYSGLLRVPARNQFVVIEALTEGGGSTVSRAATLVELGVDPSLLGLGDDVSQSQPPRVGERPGIWLPLVLVVGALVAAMMTVQVFRRESES